MPRLIWRQAGAAGQRTGISYMDRRLQWNPVTLGIVWTGTLPRLRLVGICVTEQGVFKTNQAVEEPVPTAFL